MIKPKYPLVKNKTNLDSSSVFVLLTIGGAYETRRADKSALPANSRPADCKDGFGWRARVEYLRRSRHKYDEFEVDGVHNKGMQESKHKLADCDRERSNERRACACLDTTRVVDESS